MPEKIPPTPKSCSPFIWLLCTVTTAAVTVYSLGQFDNLGAATSDNLNILRLQNIPQYPEVDLLFTGSSYTYNAIDPQFFEKEGFSIYNLGTPTAGPYFCELILNDYLLASTKKPGQIMMLIDPVMFAPPADNWELYRIHRFLNKPISNEHLVHRYRAYADYPRMTLNSAEMGLRNIQKHFSTSSRQTAPPPLNRGYQPSDEVVTDKVVKDTRHFYAPLKHADFDKYKAAYLTDYMKRLMADGHNLILFEVPTYIGETFLSAPFLADYQDFKGSLVSDGFTILENELTLDASFYRNVDHLNSKGAAVVSTNLIARLPPAPE